LVKRERIDPHERDRGVVHLPAHPKEKQSFRNDLPPKKKKRAVDLFLDSGVFSAWTRDRDDVTDAAIIAKVRRVRNVKDYCAFIRRNEHLLECYATMDVIPGRFGERRTLEEVEASAKKSYDNQQLMKSLGTTPIPIFHQGESFKWLERYVMDGEPYVGISTAKDLRNIEQREWLDRVFSMITDKTGNPYIKTHGFGITNISLLLRYPWWTADSTTWSLAAGFGLVYVPRIDNGKPDYSSIPMRIITSGRKQAAWSSAKRQYEALNPEDLAWVQRWFKHAGVTQEEVRHRSSARRAACLKYFVEFGENYDIEPFHEEYRSRKMGLLDPLPDLSHLKAPKLWPHMRIMMATMMHNGQFSLILNAAKARNRLISYWEIIDREEELLANFVNDGITDIHYKPRAAREDWDNETYLSHRAMKHLERIAAYGQEAFD
jgi:hypothetical protein